MRHRYRPKFQRNLLPLTSREILEELNDEGGSRFPRNVTFYNTVIFIVIAVGTSNLTYSNEC
jgi:hypothetical protein